MRNIKFRAWDKKTKGMCICRDLIDWFNAYAQFEYDTKSKQIGIMEKLIFMQYTGKKDDSKVKKEIYESDKLQAGQFEYLVVWNNEVGAWVCEPIQQGHKITTQKPLFEVLEEHGGVVVGNKYEG